MQQRSEMAEAVELGEKRNHPKNKRDPMICLNGECYVTFSNKPPWYASGQSPGLSKAKPFKGFRALTPVLVTPVLRTAND